MSDYSPWDVQAQEALSQIIVRGRMVTDNPKALSKFDYGLCLQRIENIARAVLGEDLWRKAVDKARATLKGGDDDGQ